MNLLKYLIKLILKQFGNVFSKKIRLENLKKTINIYGLDWTLCVANQILIYVLTFYKLN